jgi:hypothetical protein
MVRNKYIAKYIKKYITDPCKTFAQTAENFQNGSCRGGVKQLPQVVTPRDLDEE